MYTDATLYKVYCVTVQNTTSNILPQIHALSDSKKCVYIGGYIDVYPPMSSQLDVSCVQVQLIGLYTGNARQCNFAAAGSLMSVCCVLPLRGQFNNRDGHIKSVQLSCRLCPDQKAAQFWKSALQRRTIFHVHEKEE